MTRQLRRKQARQELKQAKRGMNAAQKAGWVKVKHSENKVSKQPPVGKELASVYVLTPVETRQDFELALREFGEAIQASDAELPVPRIEYIAVFKPFPYETNEEMYTVSETILKPYSPYNVFGLITGTPPTDLDFTNQEHVYAFAYHLCVLQREKQGNLLQSELEKRISMLS